MENRLVLFKGISFKLAEMATEIEASELLIRKASHEKNMNRPMTKLSAMCKMYASEVCVKTSSEAVQIHGGYGYIKDFPVEKFLQRFEAMYNWRRNYRNSKTCYFKKYFKIILK